MAQRLKRISIFKAQAEERNGNEAYSSKRLIANLTASMSKLFKSYYEFSKQYADEITWGSGIAQGSFNRSL
jgi:hypothetical protein